MTESLGAGLLFVILLGCGALGLFVRPFLSAAHRSRETTDFIHLVVTILVTFVAVVLGLLTTSARRHSIKSVTNRKASALHLSSSTGRFANGALRPSAHAS
jgi:hypothetical protein